MSSMVKTNKSDSFPSMRSCSASPSVSVKTQIISLSTSGIGPTRNGTLLAARKLSTQLLSIIEHQKAVVSKFLA